MEERETVVAPPPPGAGIALSLQTGRAGRGYALEAKNLAKSYAAPLFSGVSVDVERGGRLAIVGPNGAGKSTLLALLGGAVEADAGSVRYNEAVRTAYFAQNARDQLDPQRSAVENVLEAADLTEEQARNLLGRMHVSGEAADKPVSAFSGGERRRIMLAALMAQRADVLLLDEPTNDLDIDSREALEEVLSGYDGALVVVSHDRYLLSRLCDAVLWIDGGDWGLLEGGYEAYEAMQREREERDRVERERAMTAEPKRTGAAITPLKVLDHLRRDITKTEREIARGDARKAEIETIFTDPSVYADVPRVKALQDELAAIAARAETLMSQWEELTLRLEELEAARG